MYNSIKRIKYLEIVLTKEVKHLCIEQYKILMKEIRDANKWKDMLCSWIGRLNILNIVKLSTLPKANYRFNVIIIKTSVAIF